MTSPEPGEVHLSETGRKETPHYFPEDIPSEPLALRALEGVYLCVGKATPSWLAMAVNCLSKIHPQASSSREEQEPRVDLDAFRLQQGGLPTGF